MGAAPSSQERSITKAQRAQLLGFLFPAWISAYFCDPWFKVFLHVFIQPNLLVDICSAKKNVRIIISLYKKGEVSLVGYQSIKSIFVIVRIKIFPLTSHAWTSPTNSCWIDCMPNNLYVAFQEVELLVHDSMFNLGCCIWLAGLDLEIFAWRTPTLWYFRSTFF